MARNIRLLTVFLVVMMDLVGFGIVLPLLPFFAAKFHATPLTIGFLYSVYSICQLIFSPIWGGLSDRIGRRPVMLISTFGSATSYLIFAWAPSLSILFFSRILAGAMGGNVSTAQAYVADVTSPAERSRGMGLIGAAFGIGFMLGPALASLATAVVSEDAAHPFAAAGILAAVLSAVSFLLVCFKLPETVRPNATPQAQSRAGIFTVSFWRSIRKTARGAQPEARHLPMCLACVLLISLSQSSLYGAFPLYCREALGMHVSAVGLIFAWMGLVTVLVQGGGIRPIVRRFGEVPVFVTGCALMAAGLALIPILPGRDGVFAATALLALGAGMSGPTIFSLTSQAAAEGSAGQTMGFSQGMSGLGRAVGPSWGGLLYGMEVTVPFFAAALCVLGAAVIGRGLTAASPAFADSETKSTV
jgi:DHA1 family tetracycline resistance protein-like MFS transporter